MAFVLVGEAACRLLPVSSATLSGYHVDPQILTYPPRHEWTSSFGWDLRNPQRLKSNNFGFVADHDFVRNANAVALVGDSFVEAGMLAAEDRPAAQLEQRLGAGRPVYALGGPGSALLDYAERIRFARQHFGVRDVVVLMERGDVMQSLCGSGNNHGPCLDRRTLQPRIETQAPPGLAKRVIRRSALAQYVVSQLKVTPGGLWRQAIEQSRPLPVAVAVPVAVPNLPSPAAAPEAPIDATLSVVDAVTRRFFQQIEGQVEGRLVIVLDSDRARIRLGQAVADDAARMRFIALARAAGALVIDTQPLFVAHHARSPLRLDVGPYDAHMNRLAIDIAMHAASQALAGPR